MRTKFAFFSALFLLLVGQVVFAQVTGTLKDSDGFPVSDAEVTVRGGSDSAFTDENGKFSINANVNDVLVITDAYGTAQDFKITKLAMGNLKFGTQTILPEVTLLGGIKINPAQKVGAYDVVSKEDFELTPFSSVDDVLNGRVAGLTFSSASGDPGSSNMVIIRGVSSLVGSPNPLYIIDGVVVGKGADNAAMMESWNPLATLDPNAIENVMVLKDASATALYGSRGANGVIIVTTKKGKFNQKTRFNFSSETAIQDRAFDKMKLMNGEEYIKYGGMLMWNSQGISGTGVPANSYSTLEEATQDYINKYEPQYKPGDYTDWSDEISRMAVVSTYNFSASGGGENTSFRIGGSYYENKPLIKSAKFNRISLNSAVDHKASERLRFGLNLNYSNVKRNTYVGGRGTTNPVNSAIMLSPVRLAYNPDGSYNQNLGYTVDGSYSEDTNPLNVINNASENATINTVIGSLNANWEFSKNFFFNSLFGAQYQHLDETALVDKSIPMFANGVEGFGYLGKWKTGILDWNWVNDITFRKKFVEKHDLELSVGMEYQDHSYDNFGAQSLYLEETRPYFGFASNILTGNSFLTWRQISYFARLNYLFGQKYQISAQGRRDGNSTLSEGNKFGTFWSVAGAWNLHEEEFIPEALSLFSIRGSYGVLGNIPYADQWGPQYNHLALVQFDSGNSGWGDNTGYGYISSPGNSQLSWEESKQLNVGVDLGVFNNRLKLTFDYYNKITENTIFYQRPAVEVGAITQFMGNVATLDNKGLELSIEATPINTNDFKWFINLNGSYQKTMVDKLYIDLYTFESDDPGSADNAFVALSPGHLLGEYYAVQYAGVDNQGNAIFYTDASMTETTTDRGAAEKVWMGKSAFPKYLAGLSSEFRYKNVGLSFLFSGQFDFYVQNGVHSYTIHDGRFATRNQIVEALYDSWTDAPGMVNHNASNPMAIIGNPSTSRLESSRFINKGDHIRLKELKIVYSFGDLFKQSTKLDAFSVYFRGTNLWTYAFDKNLDYDPESNSNSWSWIGKGRYWYASPVMRTYSLGIQIDF